jgi:hypothetical protein
MNSFGVIKMYGLRSNDDNILLKWVNKNIKYIESSTRKIFKNYKILTFTDSFHSKKEII